MTSGGWWPTRASLESAPARRVVNPAWESNDGHNPARGEAQGSLGLVWPERHQGTDCPQRQNPGATATTVMGRRDQGWGQTLDPVRSVYLAPRDVSAPRR